MNHDPRPFDDEADEREWQAQERARAAERSGAPVGGDDAMASRYRTVARALGALPREALPADFARDVARRAEADRPTRRALAAEPALGPFERALLAMLALLFAAVTVVAVVTLGLSQQIGDAVRGVGALLANRWLLALLACLVFPLVGSRTRARAQ
jgi:hypothetical protein